MSNPVREGKIQRLLRHAFGCIHNQGSHCSCSKNIQEFLQTDEVSLEWASRKKKEMIGD